jgi:hypothetical protein
MEADTMTMIRLCTAATIAGSIGWSVAVLTAPSAAASALAEGYYSFTFDGSKKTTDGEPDPMRKTLVLAGIRSACPPGGCVATALEVAPVSQSIMAAPEPNTWVYRESDGQWNGSRPRDYACNGDKFSGSESQSFHVLPDGTLTGVDTQLQGPCGTAVVPFTAKRTSADVPATQSGQTPQDPNTV